MMKKRVTLIMLSLFIMPILSVAILAATNSFYTKPLPIYGTIPEFSFTERSGKEISKSFFTRKVWVAGFIFTHCAGSCPLIMGSLLELQRAFLFKENFRIVGLTMDPKRDTPEVLKSFAEKNYADPYKFLFLTGDKNSLQSFSQNGFRLAAAEDLEEGDITHSGKLVLVDGFYRIRGYYDSEEKGNIKKLKSDIKRLLKETTF